MNQISSLPHAPVLGAAFMVGAGITFAITNILTPIITYQMGVPSTAVVFWQYIIATLFALPLILRIGVSKLRTKHPYWHEIRALLSALGVQFFAFGFALGVPVWQMVALSMTGPFFILLGATLFLGERLTVQRLGATITGFVGAVMVSQIGTEQFTLASLLPVLAALCWGSVSVITRYLSRDEEPESLTLYMLVLITQYFLSFAYKVADATYLQPFDDLKLPLNTLLGWVALSQVPAIWFWPGALLILGASSFILWSERRATPSRLQMA